MTSPGDAAASVSTLGQRSSQACQRGTTRSTCVCCSITSLTRIAYGSRVRRHGSSRRADANHARRASSTGPSLVSRYYGFACSTSMYEPLPECEAHSFALSTAVPSPHSLKLRTSCHVACEATESCTSRVHRPTSRATRGCDSLRLKKPGLIVTDWPGTARTPVASKLYSCQDCGWVAQSRTLPNTDTSARFACGAWSGAARMNSERPLPSVSPDATKLVPRQ